MLTLTGLDQVKDYVGKELGVSDWHLVTQEEIDEFARVTGDDQWIHVDVERAKESPFGGTIAHGYYTLSLAPRVLVRHVHVRRLRLRRQLRPEPACASRRRCRSATRVRMRAKLASVEDIPAARRSPPS